MDILSNLIIQKVYSINTIYTEKNSGAKRNLRPCWAIITKFEGETIYTCGGKSYISNANNIFILPKGCSYDWVCTESGHFSIIEFEADITNEEIFQFHVPNSEKILKIFNDIEYKHSLKTPLSKLECIKGTYDILLSLIKSSAKTYVPSDKQMKIQPAVDFITKNYNKSIKNDELAAITNLSTVYFRKLFKEIFGISPIAYIQALRIKKSKEMLKSDYSSISDIASSVGYTNIYDFSRAFKKYTGISPSKYSKTK